jgi:hypothetical protein
VSFSSLLSYSIAPIPSHSSYGALASRTCFRRRPTLVAVQAEAIAGHLRTLFPSILALSHYRVLCVVCAMAPERTPDTQWSRGGVGHFTLCLIGCPYFAAAPLLSCLTRPLHLPGPLRQIVYLILY